MRGGAWSPSPEAVERAQTAYDLIETGVAGLGLSEAVTEVRDRKSG